MLTYLILCVGSCLPLCFPLYSPQQPDAAKETAKLPDTHAGRCAAAFIDAFNSGDAARVRAFEEKYRAQSALKKRSIDDRIKQSQQLAGDWGRLTPREVSASQDRGISLLVHAGNGNRLFEFRFVFEEQEPFGLDHVEIEGPIPSGPAATTPLTAEVRASTIAAVSEALESRYVFPETAKKMVAALQQNEKSGAYNQITNPLDFARRLTDDLRDVCKDRHLGITIGGLPEDGDGGPMRHRGTPDDARRENFGFREVKLLPGNIGYIRFDEFNPSEQAKSVAAAAMGFLANSDALIFDMRYNGGGSPEMIRFLTSYLLDKPTHLNSFYDRTSEKTEEFWTFETIPGRRFSPDLPVYVLTSKSTFSGAEEFSYNLLNLKRATIVGEVTGGGAHPVMPVRLNDRFNMMVPYARAVNPISGTNWEGVGVKPHVEVPADEALETARQLASKKIEALRSASPGR